MSKAADYFAFISSKVAGAADRCRYIDLPWKLNDGKWERGAQCILRAHHSGEHVFP
jgi:hypothetical protein